MRVSKSSIIASDGIRYVLFVHILPPSVKAHLNLIKNEEPKVHDYILIFAHEQDTVQSRIAPFLVFILIFYFFLCNHSLWFAHFASKPQEKARKGDLI